VLAIPGFFGSALDPLIGVLGDTSRRRAVMMAGGLAFALSAVLTTAAVGFWTFAGSRDRKPGQRRIREPCAGDVDGPRAGAA